MQMNKNRPFLIPYLHEESFKRLYIVIAGYDKKRLTVFLRPVIIRYKFRKKRKPPTPKIIYQADSTEESKLILQLKRFKRGKVFGTYHNLDI